MHRSCTIIALLKGGYGGAGAAGLSFMRMREDPMSLESALLLLVLKPGGDWQIGSAEQHEMPYWQSWVRSDYMYGTRC